MFRSLLAVLLWAGASAAERPFFFIQMSDPQFGMYTSNQGFEQETANFEFAIATANRLRPAFVIVTGDLVNQPGDPAQIAEYKRIVAKLDPSIPVHHVAGNHDVGNDPTPESLAVYREHLGRDWYSFRSGDMAGIVLDSCMQKAPGRAAAEAARQEEWLRAELPKLKASGAQQIILFQHHPLFLKDAGEKEEYFNLPVETRRRLLRTLHQYSVKWAFTGHHHRNGEARDGDLTVVVTGPVGKPLGGKSGFRIVKVGPAGVGQRYYDFSELPNAVE
jgi:serine/threonine-protein phosphatase CPPED1